MGRQDGLCENGEEDYDGNVCEEEYDRSKAAANPPDAILMFHIRIVNRYRLLGIENPRLWYGPEARDPP